MTAAPTLPPLKTMIIHPPTVSVPPTLVVSLGSGEGQEHQRWPHPPSSSLPTPGHPSIPVADLAPLRLHQAPIRPCLPSRHAMGSTGPNPICTHCGSTKSPLWRRGVHSEILCNACGLYWKHHGTYRPLALKVAADKKEPRKPLDVLSMPMKRERGSDAVNLRRLKAALGERSFASASFASAKKKVSRRIGRKTGSRPHSLLATYPLLPAQMTPMRGKTGSAGKISLPSTLFLHTGSGRWRGEPVFAPELTPSAGSANVRLIPAEIRASSASDSQVLHQEGGGAAAIIPSKSQWRPVKYIMLRGRLLFIGDHVAVRGDDGQIYFAIVCDFWMVPSGAKYFSLQWLLPKLKHALLIDGPREHIDPSFFILGPMHDRAEQLDSIVDVFFSPQSLRRPLEGPTPLISSFSSADPATGSASSTPSSRPCSPLSRRAGSIDETLPQDDYFSFSVSGLDTPPERERGGAVGRREVRSDSEVELHRPVCFAYGLSPSPSERSPLSPGGEATSILEDVEMAHLLCSMVV